MGKLNEIRNRLKAGDTPRQLIAEGYSRSSVYRENKKLNNPHPDTTIKPVNDELQELRQRRDIAKLQREIAEIEANKEMLPDRVAALEKTVLDQRILLSDSVDTAFYNSLVYARVDMKEAKELADGWVDRIDKKIRM